MSNGHSDYMTLSDQGYLLKIIFYIPLLRNLWCGDSYLWDFEASIDQSLHCIYTRTYQPLLSARPRHNVSVVTIRSMSFFHSIPSEITRYHSLHTSSAAHSDFASRYDRIVSAMWSKPLARKVEENLNH